MSNTTKGSTLKINSTAIIAVLVFSAFIATFNETILNVALSSIMKDFNITAGTVQWVITAYMLVTSIMVPVTAFLYETFKTKNIFTVAMILLLLGTILCAFSTSLPLLMIARMIQASGTGMMIPIMMNTVLLVAPKEKIGISMAVCGCAISLGPAFGPTVSGVILQFLSWHMLFVILLPIIIIALILGRLNIQNVAKLSKPKLDFLSVILSTVGLAAIIYGISSAFTNKSIALVFFIVGIIIIAIFAMRQRKLKEPMLNLDPFKYSKFNLGVVMVMVAMMISFTMNVILPLYLEDSLHVTSFVSALTLLPAVLCNAAATAVAGKVLDKHGVKVMLPVGFLVMLIAVFTLSRYGASTPVITILVTYIFVQLGVAFTMSPSQTCSLRQLPKHIYTHGVALMNTFTQISACIGSSMFVGVMSYVERKKLAGGSVSKVNAVAIGFSSAVMVAFVIVLLGFIVALIFTNVKSKANNDANNDANNLAS